MCVCVCVIIYVSISACIYVRMYVRFLCMNVGMYASVCVIED